MVKPMQILRSNVFFDVFLAYFSINVKAGTFSTASLCCNQGFEAMSKNKAFWLLWIFFVSFVIISFYLLGELKSVDFGKAVILTLVSLIPAYPIYRFVQSNEIFD